MMRHPVSFYPIAVAILVLSIAIRLVAGRYARRHTGAESLPQGSAQ
jgi:methionine sulfoxide reductase heme-binding subunit